MPGFTTRHPIFDIDRAILMPEDTVITAEMLKDFVRSNVSTPFVESSLMEHGTVRDDMLGFMSAPAYRVIYSGEGSIASLMTDLESVRLPAPVLESLDFFKEKDSYSYRHFLSVFALSTFLAREVLSDYKGLLSLTAAGPTHDIGKVCVPIEILQKRTPLTRFEKDMLDHHTMAGYVLLSCYALEVDGLSSIVARDHHERNNGKGKPRGVVLDDLLTEIVAVCDVYDALITSRPYRAEPFDNRTALEEITELGNKGEFSWRVIKTLIASNRYNKPDSNEVTVSPEKRGTPPEDNSHGKLADD